MLSIGGWCFFITDQIFKNIHNFLSFVNEVELEPSKPLLRGWPEIAWQTCQLMFGLEPKPLEELEDEELREETVA